MKKVFIILLFLFLLVLNVSADSDYEGDYTLIDCVNGDNINGIPFDSTNAYATLKEGIENTIDYINSNINILGNEEVSSGKIFNIKVACSFDDILNQSISLDYNGVDFNNELIIEGIDENSFIIKEIDFQLGYKAGNITFKNAKFLNENKPYFYDFMVSPSSIKYATGKHPVTNGIKIIDSYLKLKNGNNLGDNTYYNSYSYRSSGRYYKDHLYNYSNKQIIENSIIDVEIDNYIDFYMPVFLKDSKLNFINTNLSGSLDVNFIEEGNVKNLDSLNYSVFVSNQIDMGNNNLSIEDSEKIAFLNNSILHVKSLDLTGAGVFINNYFENNESVDVSGTHELYNNIFASGFIDTYDIMNNRKNFAENNAQDIGWGWVYKRLRENKYFNLDINSADLYKEVTGNKLPGGLGEIYIIFNY